MKTKNSYVDVLNSSKQPWIGEAREGDAVRKPPQSLTRGNRRKASEKSCFSFAFKTSEVNVSQIYDNSARFFRKCTPFTTTS